MTVSSGRESILPRIESMIFFIDPSPRPVLPMPSVKSASPGEYVPGRVKAYRSLAVPRRVHDLKRRAAEINDIAVFEQ